MVLASPSYEASVPACRPFSIPSWSTALNRCALVVAVVYFFVVYWCTLPAWHPSSTPLVYWFTPVCPGSGSGVVFAVYWCTTVYIACVPPFLITPGVLQNECGGGAGARRKGGWITVQVHGSPCKCTDHSASAGITVQAYGSQCKCKDHSASARITVQVHGSQCKCRDHSASARIAVQVHGSQCKCTDRSAAEFALLFH